ncbi:hypothetical protein SLE2022_176060 [Rubroshorea leprosula]
MGGEGFMGKLGEENNGVSKEEEEVSIESEGGGGGIRALDQPSLYCFQVYMLPDQVFIVFRFLQYIIIIHIQPNPYCNDNVVQNITAIQIS